MSLDWLSHLVADFTIVVNRRLYSFIDRCKVIDVCSLHNCTIESFGIDLFELSVNEAGQLVERIGSAYAEQGSYILSVDLEAVLEVNKLRSDRTVEALVSSQDGLLVDLIFTIVFHFAPFLSSRLSTFYVTTAGFVTSI